MAKKNSGLVIDDWQLDTTEQSMLVYLHDDMFQMVAVELGQIEIPHMNPGVSAVRTVPGSDRAGRPGDISGLGGDDDENDLEGRLGQLGSSMHEAEGVLGSGLHEGGRNVRGDLDRMFQETHGGMHFVGPGEAAGYDQTILNGSASGPVVIKDDYPTTGWTEIPPNGVKGDPFEFGGSINLYGTKQGERMVDTVDARGRRIEHYCRNCIGTPNPLDGGTERGGGRLPTDGSGHIRPRGDVLDLSGGFGHFWGARRGSLKELAKYNEKHGTGSSSKPGVKHDAPINPTDDEPDLPTTLKSMFGTFDGVFDPTPIESVLNTASH